MLTNSELRDGLRQKAREKTHEAKRLIGPSGNRAPPSGLTVTMRTAYQKERDSSTTASSDPRDSSGLSGIARMTHTEAAARERDIVDRFTAKSMETQAAQRRSEEQSRRANFTKNSSQNRPIMAFGWVQWYKVGSVGACMKMNKRRETHFICTYQYFLVFLIFAL